MRKSFLLSIALSFCFWIFGQPVNDNPCGAIALTVNTYCNTTNHTTVGSTNSNIPFIISSPSCANYNGQDVWFSFTVPATGNFQIRTSAGSITDSGLSLYTAALGCAGAMTELACNDDSGAGNMSRITRMGMTPGQTIYARVWQSGGGTGTFGICVFALNNCGSANNNDNCPSPATLFQGTGSFSASTDGTFTADEPGNVEDIFCGSIENNSWYRFTANSTTHSFPITYVGGCENNQGIQAHVYQVTTNASGCCTNFVSKSNCYNPGNMSLGTVTANGLTVGQQYFLMIDGYAGDGCEFTISGWTAINVLPVEMVELTGEALTEGNLIEWKTESEHDNDYFEVMHSRNGNLYEPLSKIPSKGNDNQLKSYSFLHQGPYEGINYYKLRQVDLNGSSKESEAIAVYSETPSGLFTMSPNPASNEVNLTFNSNKEELVSWSIYNFQGQLVISETKTLQKGTSQYGITTSDWKKGVYAVVIESKNGTTVQKLIIE